MNKKKIDGLMKEILKLRDKRNWAQFHDPKNLAEAIGIESGELLEQFLWKTLEKPRKINMVNCKRFVVLGKMKSQSQAPSPISWAAADALRNNSKETRASQEM